MTRKNRHPRTRIAIGVVAAAAIAAVCFLPLREWAGTFETWIDGMGPAGVLLFVAIYVIVTVLLLPAWMFTVAAGALFGIVGGFAIAWGSALVGAATAFLIARYAARERVRKHLSRNSLLRTIDKALRKAGWKVVALLRLSPLVPFTVQNYFFGVTPVKLWEFLAGTALGMLPGTMVEIWLGATGRAAAGGGSAAQWTLLGIGIAATVAAMGYIGRVARRRLGIRSGPRARRRPAARART